MTNTKSTADKPIDALDRLHECRCFAQQIDTYEEVYDLEDGSVEYTPTNTPIYGLCDGWTTREFAQGHDAKLKGALIKAHLADEAYIYRDGSMLVHCDPMEVAKQRGWGHFLDNAKRRRDELPARRKAQRLARKVRNATPTTVKVGRWSYPIVEIVSESVNSVVVRYQSKQGVKESSVKRAALGFGKVG